MSFGVYLYPRVSLTDCICLCAAYFTNTKKKVARKYSRMWCSDLWAFAIVPVGLLRFYCEAAFNLSFFYSVVRFGLFCVAASSAAACVLIPFKWSHLSTLSLDDGITRLFMHTISPNIIVTHTLRAMIKTRLTSV